MDDTKAKESVDMQATDGGRTHRRLSETALNAIYGRMNVLGARTNVVAMEIEQTIDKLTDLHVERTSIRRDLEALGADLTKF
ncbi:hypothetical protein SAMN02745157_1439 [Kaistia soli DSM 19436]|uniref:Uncharacterized protein n=1 Tax=Kaistia soli DSM 19436 TaxID=1122133 RepID=A0A1M4Y6Q8_9HYPH|nr:hypothetical protein [Kaistia soli]SHF01359.1 hypothetical protein SAMN02745157_1439 [Kaistia soli DSM 19436]